MMKLKSLMRTAMARPKSAFRSSDVARAVKGATAGGLLVASVLITQDGSILVNTSLGSPSGNTIPATAPAGDPDDDPVFAKLDRE
jgi:hypothetical protein